MSVPTVVLIPYRRLKGIHVQAGDSLIYATFEVKDDVDVLKRRMPITLELAVIDDDTETGKQILREMFGL